MFATQSQISQDLRFKNRVETFDPFKFNNYGIFDQKIKPVFADGLAFINHGNDELPLEVYSRSLKLNR